MRLILDTPTGSIVIAIDNNLPDDEFTICLDGSGGFVNRKLFQELVAEACEQTSLGSNAEFISN